MADSRRSVSDPRTLVTHPELRSQRSIPTFKTLGEAPKNRIERALSIFADVRAGEGTTVLLLTLNIFLLLGLYYLLKPARAALILTEGGAEVAVYSSAAQAVLLLGFVPAFGWLASRVSRMKFITITSLFFAANLGLFYVFGRAGAREGVAFYIWLGIFNNFIVSQFWAFANDIYTEGQGRRLFPLVGVGASIGAWLGASAVSPLISNAGFTPYTLMALGATLLVVALGITVVVNRRERSHAHQENVAIAEAPLGKAGGFELIRHDRYLMWIAILTVLLNFVNTTGEYLLGKLVETTAETMFPAADQIANSRAFIGSFMGDFYGVVNLLGLLVQLFVTSRVMRYMGVRGALFILPAIALVNYSVIAVAPLLAVVRITKILENSTDYSIQNTVRHALFLPTSREAKYKAKAAVDTFFARLGDVTSAGVVKIGTTLAIGVTGFGWVMTAVAAAWLVVAGQIAREHRKKTV
jgi:AAA family ATP:ADP antiporter